jgi:virulence-associated protein VapD
MARYLKALKVKHHVLNQNLKYAQEKRAVKKWFERTQCTLFLRRRNQQVLEKYRLRETKKVFEEWVKSIRIVKALCSRTFKFINRL